jgi:hypothetical protein
MRPIFEALPSAKAPRFFTESRIEFYALATLALYVAFLAKGLLAGVWFDAHSGSNFLPLWCAAKLAAEGRAASAYDWDALRACESATVHREIALITWVYPPTFLALVSPLSLIPYRWALGLWEVATFGGFLWVIHAIIPRRSALMAAAAVPATLWNLFEAQNAFLFAALLGGALIALESRPLLAGILLALLTCKPQLGLLVPMALVCGGYWRAIGWAALVFASLVGMSCLVLGGATWSALFATSQAIVEVNLGGSILIWTNITTPFGMLRWFGIGTAPALAAFIVLAAAAAASVWWLWRSSSQFSLKAAALSAGALIATPYLLLYDLTLATVAGAFLAQHMLAYGAQGSERTALLLLACALAYPVAGVDLPPIGCLIPMTLLGMAVLRSIRQPRLPQAGADLSQRFSFSQ